MCILLIFTFCLCNIRNLTKYLSSFNTYHVVKTNRPSFKEDLSRPSGVDGEPQLHHIKTDILVEAVQYELTEPMVVPRSMDE